MIFDNQALLSKAQAITATAASTNAIDLGAMGTVFGQSAALLRDVGKGNEIPFLCQCVQTFNNLTSLAIALEFDTTTTFTPDKTIPLVSGVLLAQLIAGYQVPFKVLPRGLTMQYMQLKYTVTGSAPTLGAFTAGVVMSVQESGMNFTLFQG